MFLHAWVEKAQQSLQELHINMSETIQLQILLEMNAAIIFASKKQVEFEFIKNVLQNLIDRNNWKCRVGNYCHHKANRA